MTTKLIGIKEFSKNPSKCLRHAQEKGVHFVVMRHNEPVANITPIQYQEDDEGPEDYGMTFEELAAEIAEAREQVKRGEVYTEEEIAKKYDVTL